MREGPCGDVEAIWERDFQPILDEPDDQGDAAERVVRKLRESFPAAKFRNHGGVGYDLWSRAGNTFFRLGRPFDAAHVFDGMYDLLLEVGEQGPPHEAKAVPLFNLSECYRLLGWPWHARRYLMLALCEDAFNPESGRRPGALRTYWQLVGSGGMSKADYQRYLSEAATLAESRKPEAQFPEWVLQSLPDRDWMTSPPSPAEMQAYKVRPAYAQLLMSKLGDGTGAAMELLAQYLLECMPGCRTRLRERSAGGEHDLICYMEGPSIDFRTELGRHFICECKDRQRKTGFSDIARLCRVLDSVNARFGIVFSRNGITGERTTTYAERERLKVYQQRGIVLVVVDGEDLRDVVAEEGANFTAMLRGKYESVRLDLRRARTRARGKEEGASAVGI